MGNDVLFSKKNTVIYKGMAIIFVIVSHLPRLFPNLNLTILNPLGYFGVAIFLFLSGYGIEKTIHVNGIENFWIKRIIKLIPTVTIVTLATVLIDFTATSRKYSIITILLSCLGLNNSINSVTWYLGFLWFCYLSIYILHKFRIPVELVIIGLPLAILAHSIVGGGTVLNMWGLNSFSFSFGVYIANKNKENIFCKKLSLIFSLLLFLLSFFVYYVVLKNSSCLILRNPCKSFIALLFLLTYFSCFAKIEMTMNNNSIFSFSFLDFLGNVSFELFLIHAPFIFLWKSVFDITYKFITIPSYLIISGLLSWIVHIFIKKINFGGTKR